MPGEITGLSFTPGQKNTAIIGDNSTRAKIKFNGSDSKTVEFEIEAVNEKSVQSLYSLIDKYATKDSPTITPEEVIDMRTEFAKTFTPMTGRHSIDFYKGLSFLLDTYTCNKSEGDEQITPKEIASIFECIKSWLGK